MTRVGPRRSGRRRPLYRSRYSRLFNDRCTSPSPYTPLYRCCTTRSLLNSPSDPSAAAPKASGERPTGPVEHPPVNPRGTAAAALKALRTGPARQHFVPDTPKSEHKHEPPWLEERLLIQQGVWSHVRSLQVRRGDPRPRGASISGQVA